MIRVAQQPWKRIIPAGQLLNYEAQVNPNGPPTIIVRLINDDVEYSRGEGGQIWRRILRSRETGYPLPLAKEQVAPIYDFRWIPLNWRYPIVVPYTRFDFWDTLEQHGGTVKLYANGAVMEVPESEAQVGLLSPVAPLVLE